MSERRPSRRTILATGLACLPLAACATTPSGANAPATDPSASGPPAGTTTSSASASSTRAAASSPSSMSPMSPSGSAAADAPSPAAGPDITHGPRTGTGVALTFHGAGDPAVLDRMLAVASSRQTKLTVLAIGTWLASQQAVARRILEAGHELGNHSWSHQTMTRLSAAQLRDEVARCEQELVGLTGSPGRWFRPSGTPTSTPAIRAAAVAAGYGACLAYDVDSLDYTDPGAEAITRNVIAGLRPGAIVSLHLGHPQTVQAMPAILDALAARGLQAVTVSTLLGRS